MKNMHKFISEKVRKKIVSILDAGTYNDPRNSNRKKIKTEYLGLGLLIYIIETGIKSWRSGYPADFKECPISLGRRRQAVVYLHNHGLISYRLIRRFVAKKEDLIRFKNKLEKELDIRNR